MNSLVTEGTKHVKEERRVTAFQKVLTAEKVLTTPFSSYIIAEGDRILYFTQAFVELSGINPSQSSPKLSDLVNRNLVFDVPEDSYSIYDIYLCHQKSSSISEFQNSWVKDLVHELRTSSSVLELGTHVITETENPSLRELSKTLTKASHRQRISTLIASDLIQLLANPPDLAACYLLKAILRGWNSLKDPNLKLKADLKINSNEIISLTPLGIAKKNSEIKQYNINLNTTFNSNLPNVFVDSGQIQQVLFNLILNSIEAIKDSGEITISCHPVSNNLKQFQRKSFYKKITHKPYLLVHIGDSGCGMSVEVLQNIFNPFYTTKSYGTGLGLSLTKALIEMHGGKIWAESKGKGLGSTFRFIIPI